MKFYSIVDARGTGDYLTLTVPEYISRDHISVYVDGIPFKSFEWLTAQTIRVLAPANRLVRVVRRTSPEALLTDYKDGTQLPGETLRVDSKQAFYLAQEAYDLAILAGGSAGGTVAPGTELTIGGILALLQGQLDIGQFAQSLRETIGLIKGPEDLLGSPAWRVAQEQLARNEALRAERDARIQALLKEAADRDAAIKVEETARTAATDALAERITTLNASTAQGISALQNTQKATADSLAAVAQDQTLMGTRLGVAESSIAQEATSRSSADNALASSVENIRVALEGADAALSVRVNNEVTARVQADNALATRVSSLESKTSDYNDAPLKARIDTVESTLTTDRQANALAVQNLQSSVGALGTQLGTVQTSASTTANKLGTVEAQWTLKVQARSDGKNAIAGIGLNSKATNEGPTQSEMVFAADQFKFVPSMADYNFSPAPLFVAGVVEGQNTFVLPKQRFGDKLIEGRMVVDGTIEARHIKVNSIDASRIDTRGLSIKDAAGNVILAAGVPLAASALPPEANSANVASSGCINRDPTILMPSVWTRPSTITINGPSDTAGATAGFYLSCSSGVDQISWDAGPTRPGGFLNYPLDPGRTYNLNANFYQGPGNDRNMYLVVDMFDASGNRVASTWGGTYSGYTYGGLLPAQGRWYRVGNEFGANTARPIPGNVTSCRIGVWFQYSGAGSSQVQQAAQDVRLVDVTTGKTADWGTVASRPRVLEAVSAGYQNTTAPRSPGVWVDGVYAANTFWWGFAWLNPSTLVPVEVFTIGPGGNGPDAAADKLEWYLNNSPNVILTVTTSDHPTGMYNARMLEALYRYGASRGGLGSDAFLGTFRAAYSLIGRPHSPPGSAVESFTRTSSAHCVSTALIKDGMILDNQKDIQITPGNVSSYIANTAIGSAQVGRLTAGNLSIGAVSDITGNVGLLRTASTGGRQEIESMRTRIFDQNGALRYVHGYLL